SRRSRENKRYREKEAWRQPHLNFALRLRICAPRGPLFPSNTTHLDDLQLHDEPPQIPGALHRISSSRTARLPKESAPAESTSGPVSGRREIRSRPRRICPVSRNRRYATLGLFPTYCFDRDMDSLRLVYD